MFKKFDLGCWDFDSGPRIVIKKSTKGKWIHSFDIPKCVSIPKYSMRIKDGEVFPVRDDQNGDWVKTEHTQEIKMPTCSLTPR